MKLVLRSGLLRRVAPLLSEHRHSSALRRRTVGPILRSPTRATQRAYSAEAASAAKAGSAASQSSRGEAGLARRSPKGEGGFTLAEIIAVATIIAILAAAVIGGIIFAQKRAAIAATRGLLGGLSMAINEYRDDYGAYPPDGKPSAGWTSWYMNPGVNLNMPSETLWYFLARMYEVIPENKRELLARKTPYMNFKEKDLKRTGTAFGGAPDSQSSTDMFPEIVDAWGSPINYRAKESYVGSPRVNMDSFDLVSCGPDRLVSGNYEDRNVEVNRDNIGNW